MATKTRYIGTCALCWQEVRCPDGTLAHHGYKRPGWGYIHGSCAGTGYEPWEVNVITGKMALDYFKRQVPKIQGELDALPDATQLTPRWGQKPKPVIKAEAQPYVWRQLYESIEHSLTQQLKEATRLRDEYEQKVRDWKPTKVTTLEEEEAAKRQKAEVGRKIRLDKYEENRSKTVAYLSRAYANVLKGEAAIKAAKNAEQTAKALAATCKSARVIYDTYVSKPDKLQTNYPGHVDRDFIIADWKLDDMLKHMGLISGGVYVPRKEASKREYDFYYDDPAMFLWKGLDAWKPFWPGWNGTIHYPEGSTGESRDRKVWPT